ncbi:MAG: helix-turn-helix domain-containing protein [Lachnospiraceae bacterium]
MEFHTKLQELRKQKGLTQEELAEELYVSRTAISKWESGRGYPNIDSLKAISKFFAISLDELLSGDEIITIAEEDSRRKEKQNRDLVFGLLDCSVAMFLFLPFFGQKVDNVIQEVSLLSLTESELYVKIPYLIIVFGLILWGILGLALQNCTSKFWVQIKDKVSLGLSALGALFFMISLQPYAAAFTFLFLVVKALMLIKWA